MDADSRVMNPVDDHRWLRERPAWPLPLGTLRAVDLFAGCGGMSFGFEAAAREAGWAVTGLAIEVDPAIAVVYAKNCPGMHTIAGRVEDFFDGDCGDAVTPREARLAGVHAEADILMGGPPCQGHSDLNDRTRRTDPRNRLYLRMARAAEVLRPRVVVVENVPAVIHDALDVVRDMVKILEKSNFAVAERVIRLGQIGVPQMRRRHLLVASSCAVDPNAILDQISSLGIEQRSVRWAIEDLEIGDKSPLGVPARRSLMNIKRMRHLFEHDVYDLPNSLRPPCHRDKAHSYNAVYGRLRWDASAPTITTGFTSMGQGRYVHPSLERTLTAHEAARLQAFPDWFDWHTDRRTLLSTMIGNAVPPLLMARLTGLFLRHLTDSDDCRQQGHPIAENQIAPSR